MPVSFGAGLFLSFRSERQAEAANMVFSREVHDAKLDLASISIRKTFIRRHAFTSSFLLQDARLPAEMPPLGGPVRSEEHTSELQSLMRISYAVFCLKKKKQSQNPTTKQR